MHSGHTWRLGHRPALDGLRGIAILLVIANHVEMPHGQYAGQVGVGAFFVLSGFLITSLLLEESSNGGGLRLRAFYIRRALRLTPALIACVAVVTAFAAYVNISLGPGGAPAALLYVMDFVQSSRSVYQPGLLAHTWSLAVEEQFYIVWPLALTLLMRYRLPVVRVLAAGALALAAWTFALDALGSPDLRLMYAPDTRAAGLLAGCALAAAFSNRRMPVLPRPWFWVGLAGLPIVAWAPNVGLTTAAELVLTVPLAVLVVWACVDGGPVQLLSVRWLQLLGQRSYGVYLWHFPLLGFVYFAAPTAAWWVRALVALAITAVVVELSWRFVEQPILRAGRRFRSGSQGSVGVQTSRFR